MSWFKDIRKKLTNNNTHIEAWLGIGVIVLVMVVAGGYVLMTIGG